MGTKISDNKTDTDIDERKTRLKLVTDLERTGYVDKALTAEVTNYDAETVNDFLDVVLHAGQRDDEELPFWRCTIKSPKVGYPVTEETFFAMVMNGKYKTASRCYVGTSTLTPCKQGLRNKGEQIVTTRMVVLDDIGTKIPIERIKLPPTYIIESSEGNFQYGYVFDTPIDKPDAAAELVALLYNAGMSDAGGKMANKLVRLPCGVNGKASEDSDKTLFEVTLRELHPKRLYSPQQIIDGLGLNADWAKIYAGAKEHAKARSAEGEGAALWTHAVAPTYKGVVDPVLEWLIEQNMYEGDNGEFVTIRCPNAAEHTTGDGTAGYRPVGRGNDPQTRAFHCFHDHCSHFRTVDFLAYVSANGGPQAAVRDEAAHLTSEWIYDAYNDGAWKIQNTQTPYMVSMKAFRTLYPHPVLVVDEEGRIKKTVKQHNLWVTSRSRVDVLGQTYCPANPARIVEIKGQLMVNTYTPPRWGTGPVNDDDVKMFVEFLEYLIPSKIEREYFLDWLACKANNMGFRGAAIVMVAERQGTGRTTLSDMLKTLFGGPNVKNVPFDKMVNHTQFNEWQEAPIVVTDETLNTGDVSFHRTYERLKEFIDPRPKETTINPKYGRTRTVLVYTSYLFFSNHTGALSLDDHDRRFYVITNADTPAEIEYFTRLNEWLDTKDDEGQPAWCASVWRWLLARDVDEEALLKPPVSTAGKQAMREASKSPITCFVECFIKSMDTLGLCAAAAKDVVDIAARFDDRLDLKLVAHYKRVVKNEFFRLTKASKRVRVGKSTPCPRMTPSAFEDLALDDRVALRDDHSQVSAQTNMALKTSCERIGEPETRQKLCDLIGDLLGDYEL